MSLNTPNVALSAGPHSCSISASGLGLGSGSGPGSGSAASPSVPSDEKIAANMEDISPRGGAVAAANVADALPESVGMVGVEQKQSNANADANANAEADGEDEDEPDSDAPLQEEEGPTSRKPVDTAFRQNRMRAIYPLMTADRAVVAFMCIAACCFAIGLAIYYASDGVKEVSQRYDHLVQSQGCNERTKSGNCVLNVTVPITQNMDPPIYFYYALDNFYQNVRVYADSYAPDQVEGNSASTKQCKDLTESPVDGRTLYPCGLIANSFFNDSFAMYRLPTTGNFQVIGTPTEFDVNNVANDGDKRWMKQGIAFPVDVKSKFKGYANYSVYGYSRAGKDLNPLPLPNDEDTMVWMTVAALPQFRKLHRIINVGLVAGDSLQVLINSNYDVASFNGRKSFIVSTASWMGGKNIFLAWAYFAAAIWSTACAIFLVVKRRWWTREEGDLSYYAKKTPTELNRIITQGNNAAGFAAASAGP